MSESPVQSELVDGHLLPPHTRSQWIAVAIDLAAGTIGGCSGIVTGQPFDTVKVRLQAAAPGVYSGAVDCLVKSVRREGVRPRARAWERAPARAACGRLRRFWLCGREWRRRW